MNRKHKAGLAFMAAGVLLMASAIGLLLYNRMEDRKAGESIDGILPILSQEIANRESEVQEDLYFMVMGKETESDAEPVTVDGYDYIGILTIPALGLELPVMADWDYTRLKIAP
ncbi:MAG: hypothetical protein LUD07_07965, partial [Clostridiales bacterium]|nr:hypothetical protein [Clostridiales bacterium]